MDKTFILVAEDDRDDRFLLQTIFDESNAEIKLEFVNNGIELLNFLNTVRTDETLKYPLLILLDLNMPKMDGREALKQIKEIEQYRAIPIIIFSTTKNDLEIRRCYELGANTYVVKPSNYQTLSKTMESIRNYWLNVAVTP